MIELNQMVYCVGGSNTKNVENHQATEIYDIKTNKWSEGMDLHENAVKPSLVSIKNQYLYSIGGNM